MALSTERVAIIQMRMAGSVDRLQIAEIRHAWISLSLRLRHRPARPGERNCRGRKNVYKALRQRKVADISGITT